MVAARAETIFGSNNRYRVFTAVKYLTFVLISFNVVLFLQEELGALEHTFVNGIEPGQLIQVFSATIDTAAWVLLLLLFELETSVLDDNTLRGKLRYWLHGVRGLCYVAIGYAFTGYWAELIMLYDAAPLHLADACSLVGQQWSLLIDLDEYLPLDAGNCAAVGADALRLTGFEIVAPAETLRAAQWLAWTDVLNAGAWILVVVVLEIEVRLQLRGELSKRLLQINRYIKFILYFILFAAAIYWGFAGDFLDFWDAALWLFAFIFIEMNVFEWQHESQVEPAPN